MSTITIRAYQPRDKAALEQCLSQAGASLLFFEPQHEVEGQANYRQTLLALETNNETGKEADRIVAGASLYQNPLHYHPCDFRVSMWADTLKLAHQLHHALLQQLPTPLARWRMWRDAGDTLPSQLGYQVLLRSFSPVLEVAEVTADQRQSIVATMRKLEQMGYSFTTLAQFGRQRDAEVVAMCLEAYADTHTHSPPNRQENWAEIFLDEAALIPDAFFLVCKDAVPVAFSSLQAGERQAEMEAMWDGVARSERTLAYPLRLVLKMLEHDYAQKHHISKLCWEVDTVDVVGMQLLEALPFRKDDISVIWVKDVARMNARPAAVG